MILCLVLCLLCSGCSPAPPAHNAELTPSVVVDDIVSLDDGNSRAWKLEAGSYELQMSSSGDGAEVEWPGSDCPETKEMNKLTTKCRLKQSGQLVITNAATLGLGDSISVTVKVTRTFAD